MAEDNVKAQMRKGILDYCILAILSRGDSYAPKIISELKEAEMIVVEGTLYPILTRQKNAGLLTYRWEESPQGPPRKYYMLTDKGRECLASLDAAWDELVGQIQKIRHGEQICVFNLICENDEKMDYGADSGDSRFDGDDCLCVCLRTEDG